MNCSQPTKDGWHRKQLVRSRRWRHLFLWLTPKLVQLLNVVALGGVTRCILNSFWDSVSRVPEAALHQLGVRSRMC